MKIRVISNKNEIGTVICDTDILHLAFRPSDEDIIELVKKCDKVKALQVPQSYLKSLSKTGMAVLEMNGIMVLRGDVWGHRNDINEYYEVGDSVLEEIDEKLVDGQDKEEVVSKMSIKTRLSPALLGWIVDGKVKDI